METHVAVPLPTPLFVALVDFLRARGRQEDPVEIVGRAVQAWMEADEPPTSERDTATRGYQWKGVFLPDGTDLRMPYKGDNHYAKVDGDQLLFQGEATSPSAMVRAVAGSSRNAWRDLWVKRPADDSWLPAADLRRNSDAVSTQIRT